jgi:zinc protease
MAETAKIFPYPYQIKDLKNGLRVIVIKTDFPNLVNLQISVAVGSRNEVDQGRSGFAHFFEHMMFRGTKNVPAKEYTDFYVRLGAGTNAYTWTDYTNYHSTFDKKALEDVLKIEADRFKNLQFSEENLKTEAGAIMGEYNKGAADPMKKVYEKELALAFKTHPYAHTVIGYLEDIKDMPKQYAYSQTFFKRFYRPERTMIIVAGDVEAPNVFRLVEKYWGDWKRGDYVDQIPQEKDFKGPHTAHIEAKSQVQPTLSLTFVGPAFSLKEKDAAVVELLQSVLFAKSSKLYQELKIEKGWVDKLEGFYMHTTDPYVFIIEARVSDVKNFWAVRDRILEEIARLRSAPLSASYLDEIKSHRKYAFTLSLDNTESIADALFFPFVPVRDPEWINTHYRNFDRITPEDIVRVANTYFIDARMQLVTLSFEPLPVESINASVDERVKSHSKMAEASLFPVILKKSNSPLIDFKIQFRVGAAFDETGKEGLAHLTAAVLAEGNSTERNYSQLEKTLFPMAGEIAYSVDKEMTTFHGTIHKDHAEAYFQLLADQLLLPSWSESTLERIKSNSLSKIITDLRNNNEEELAKEVLYEEIYQNHPYGHLSQGHVRWTPLSRQLFVVLML